MYLSRLQSPFITDILVDREREAHARKGERAEGRWKQSPLTRIKDINRATVQVFDHAQQPEVRHSPVHIITDENHPRGFRGISLHVRMFGDWNDFSIYNNRSGVEDSLEIDNDGPIERSKEPLKS
jgi:hypothetical protein